MVHALLNCSDDDCTALYEAYGPLEEIAALACHCGCGLEIIGWPDPLETEARSLGVDLLPAAA